MRLEKILLVAVFALSSCLSFAQEIRRTPLPVGHPLIGSWRIDVPGTACFEIYNVKADGTMAVSSGDQRAESVFSISMKPSKAGFYRWIDKITKDNGKKDCMGEVMQVGHVVTNYISFHRSGKFFMMCEKEDFDYCIGPFTRVESI